MLEALNFIGESDKLKGVLRKTRTVCEDRPENSAEHSWHLCIMAIALAPYASEPVDLGRVLKMLVLHDLVEIDSGDCLVYDEVGRQAKQALEVAAADRLFGLLPGSQGMEMKSLWEEFEGQATPEARFCAALDRAQPVLANLATGGLAWREHGVSYEQVVARNRFISNVIPSLWDHILAGLDKGRDAGFFGGSVESEAPAASKI